MTHHGSESSPAPTPSESAPDRRSVSLTGVAMAGGLLAGYGAFGYIAARFLYPARGTEQGWLFVVRAKDVAVGASIRYRTPGGATVNITRRAAMGTAADFVALSSTCPHLGCQVHWENDKNRYFCPCHNGTFDPDGKGIGGPPGEAGQSLPRYQLKIDKDLLYIEVPTATLAAVDVDAGEILPATDGPEGPGHDPCLQPRRCNASPFPRCV